ncbi:uncharacterized protein L969DRAFT_94269 [Mixia osmundae IAM 14324]|uniref:GIT Spa2 homology (SHD) domain-containing protein n=1 Tax=Mixia osmundae (strain CBS 9802 / IAM 14324 / JCM 22182 / KY 12970) TaxID=764103 RepID=G7E8C7_MIXOS|nr:uncharacterized protein L969DRAFT_94269 [Mixia osmundae IAM 14324]KEI39190.1 hypothetical protein L969DRAFT_94269 [Mixia osmundae IAM 14324]GAA99087.1 hypothetical protein E5Q_05776 [Mixia osmundae IAM 14324]
MSDVGKSDSVERTARVHYLELGAYLDREGILKESQSARINAREKLTRLNIQQFQELSTDVYDELVRRLRAEKGNEIPFLPVKPDFHPKRNQARQKLATLPNSRFRDLGGDVFHELGRRFPHFPRVGSSGFPGFSGNAGSGLTSKGMTSDDSETLVTSTSNSTLQQPPRRNQSNLPPGIASNGYGAANEMLVPNKSTFVEEDVGPASDPGGRNSPYDQRDFSSGRSAGGRNPSIPRDEGAQPSGMSALTSPSRTGFGQPNGSITGTPSRLGNQQSLGGKGSEYYDKISLGTRASETSSLGGPSSARFASNGGFGTGEQTRARDTSEEIEKLKSEYEYKIATMQTRISALQRDLDSARGDSKSLTDTHANELRTLNDQIEDHRDRHQEQLTRNERLQRELEQLQLQRTTRDTNDTGASAQLSRDLADARAAHQNASATTEQLRREIAKLMRDLQDAEDAQREAAADRETDAQRIDRLQSELQVVKQQLAARSSIIDYAMPDSATKSAKGGNISEANVSEFRQSVDHLLRTSRSSTLSSDLVSAARQIVAAVSSIDKDVQIYERTLSTQDPQNPDFARLQSLKQKCHATLTNLLTAARNHATAQGLSPVSLLDAAASHLADSVIEIIKCVRQGPDIAARSQERDLPPLRVQQHDAQSYTQPQSYGPNPLSPSDSRSPTTPLENSSFSDPIKPLLTRNGSRQSDRLAPEQQATDLPLPQVRASTYGAQGLGIDAQRGYHENETNDLYGRAPFDDDEQQPAEDPYLDQARVEENWEELKHYLGTQTEAIVQSIQSLLAAIRSGASGPEVNENLTQIITIVSSIVAISKESLPAHLRNEGEDILQDLQTNCEQLSDLQTSDQGEFTKQMKQSMAKASFGVAKALKSLNAFVSEDDGLT